VVALPARAGRESPGGTRAKSGTDGVYGSRGRIRGAPALRGRSPKFVIVFGDGKFQMIVIPNRLVNFQEARHTLA
jgi:hypothetical protein